jgi:sugar phosphate permease
MSLAAGRRKIFAITWITYAGYYFCRKNLSIVLPVLYGVSGLGHLELANIVFGYSLLYALGQVGFGFLSDRIGAKRVVGSGLLLIVVSNLMMGVHASMAWLLLFACLNGIAQATGWSGLVKIMASWFNSTNRGVVMAWWGTNYVLGGFLATTFATWSIAQGILLPQWGWRRGFAFPAICVLLIAIPFWLGVDDTPEEAGLIPSESQGCAKRPANRSSWGELGALLRKRSLWMIGISYFFLELCRYALMFWLPFYMVQELKYGVRTAGYLSSLYELVGIAGAVLAGYISDHFNQSRRAPVSVVMLCGLGCVMLAESKFASLGLTGVAIAISLAGLLSYGPDTLLSGAAAQDVGETKSAATASGLIDGIGHLGALFSPYVVLYASERYGWKWLFIFLGVVSFLAAIVLVPMWNFKPIDEAATSFDKEIIRQGGSDLAHEQASAN